MVVVVHRTVAAEAMVEVEVAEDTDPQEVADTEVVTVREARDTAHTRYQGSRLWSPNVHAFKRPCKVLPSPGVSTRGASFIGEKSKCEWGTNLITRGSILRS